MICDKQASRVAMFAEMKVKAFVPTSIVTVTIVLLTISVGHIITFYKLLLKRNP